MERDNLKAHVDKMRQDFEEKTTRLQKENEKLRQENAKLSREQSRMNQDITDLTSGNQARDDKINSMSTELENIKSMVSHGMVGKKWKTGSGLFLKSLINLHVLSMQVKILITLVLGGKIAALGIITSPIFPSGLRIIQS